MKLPFVNIIFRKLNSIFLFFKHILLAIIEFLPDRYIIIFYSYKMKFVGEREVLILDKLCAANKISLDIGANNGSYSFWLQRYSNGVIGFEPQKKLYLRLVNGLPKGTFYNSALGESDEIKTLHIPVKQSFKILGEASFNDHFRNSTNEIVKIERLDKYNFQNIGFIKIDVEGYELSVLKGAIETIERNKPILLIEIEQRHSKTPIEQTFNYIERHNYSCFQLNKNLEIIRFNTKKIKNLENNNYIFIPNND